MIEIIHAGWWAVVLGTAAFGLGVCLQSLWHEARHHD